MEPASGLKRKRNTRMAPQLPGRTGIPCGVSRSRDKPAAAAGAACGPRPAAREAVRGCGRVPARERRARPRQARGGLGRRPDRRPGLASPPRRGGRSRRGRRKREQLKAGRRGSRSGRPGAPGGSSRFRPRRGRAAGSSPPARRWSRRAPGDSWACACETNSGVTRGRPSNVGRHLQGHRPRRRSRALEGSAHESDHVAGRGAACSAHSSRVEPAVQLRHQRVVGGGEQRSRLAAARGHQLHAALHDAGQVLLELEVEAGVGEGFEGFLERRDAQAPPRWGWPRSPTRWKR